MEHYNGRIIAIDASMAIYQFLVRASPASSGTLSCAQTDRQERRGLTGITCPAILPLHPRSHTQIAIRRGGDGAAATMLTNEAGEVTSHIQVHKDACSRVYVCVRVSVDTRFYMH